MAMEIDPSHTILFHGNCIDGWFSAYIAYSRMHNMPLSVFPISHSQPNTWPKMEQMCGTHIILLDVSVPSHVRDTWMAGGALSINCIYHHESSISDWAGSVNPINTKSCAALQTFEHFYPQTPVPKWLYVIDRIDRWENVTYEDRCIREMLNIIAHKPVQLKTQEAIKETEEFIQKMSTVETASAYIQQGAILLQQKDTVLSKILDKGVFHHISQEYIDKWNLPLTWLNTQVYIIDNTGITFDSTEASHIVFNSYPHVKIFVNYRKKVYRTHGILRTVYVYSARSNGINLTEGTIFRGHPCAAGATIVKEEDIMAPFVL